MYSTDGDTVPALGTSVPPRKFLLRRVTLSERAQTMLVPLRGTPPYESDRFGAALIENPGQAARPTLYLQHVQRKGSGVEVIEPPEGGNSLLPSLSDLWKPLHVGRATGRDGHTSPQVTFNPTGACPSRRFPKTSLLWKDPTPACEIEWLGANVFRRSDKIGPQESAPATSWDRIQSILVKGNGASPRC